MSDARASTDDRKVLVVIFAGLVVLLAAGSVLLILRLGGGEASKAAPGQALSPTAPRTRGLEGPFGARFTDVASDSGVDHRQADGASGSYLLPETMGSGVALGDLDSDGDADLLLLSFGSGPRLYRNDTPPGGPIRFTDVTEATPLNSIARSTAAALGDVDGDGRLDLLVATVGPDRLLLNQGALRFEESQRLGDSWTSATGFLDVDGDGDQDLFSASYVEWSPEIDLEVDFTLDGVGRAYGPPTGFRGTDLELHINDGAGRFSPEAAQRGLQLRRTDRPVPVMKALGLSFEDVDEDGDPDVLVANDTTPNRLLLNDGSGHFVDAGASSGFAYDIDGNSTGAMGIDTHRDPQSGRLICAIGNFANEPSSLFVQGGSGTFIDQSSLSGVGAPTRNALTFGTLLLDLDLDGRVDLLQVNGHIEPRIALVQSGQSYDQAAQVFRGLDRVAGFELVPSGELGALSQPISGRAAAVADLDQDGDPDLVVSHIDGVPLILRNDLDPAPGSVVEVTVVGPPGAPNGAGALIEVLESNGRVLHRQRLQRTRSYLAQCALVGLYPRSLPALAHSVRVTFPDGARRTVLIPSDGITVVDYDAPDDSG